MGLSDRDYARVADPAGPGQAAAGGGGGRRGWFFNRGVFHAGPGGMPAHRAGIRGVRMTTWLIIINAVIFFLGATVFTSWSYVSYGAQYLPGVTAAQVERAVFSEKEPLRSDPKRPGVFARTLYESVAGPNGTRALDPNNLRAIGNELYIVQGPLERLGAFSTAMAFMRFEVWRFVTFQFLHSSVMHLAFNLLGLWFAGYLVEEFLGSRKRFLAFYLTCGIFGALMYLALNFTGNLLMNQWHWDAAAKVPFLLFDSLYTPLVGASAGIFGVMLAAAYCAPHETVYVMGIIPMPMPVAVYLFTAIALVNLYFGSKNAGGEAAHIGGAIAGFFFIRRMHLLRDFFDIFGDSRGNRAERRAARERVALASGRGGNGSAKDPRIDAILAKISATGIASLSEEEKVVLKSETLRRAD
ncbi:hypothetical protein BH11PLA1_BH11PLA1_07310 [soil metagenome]